MKRDTRITLATLGAVVAVLALGMYGYSERLIVPQGRKVGTVIKVSQEGFFHRTWEGELIRGGMQNGSGGFSTTPLYFTITDPRLLEQVNAALDGQYEVEVTFVEYQNRWYDSGNYGTFLTSIRRR